MIREDWAFACEASRTCLAVTDAVERGDEEAFLALWSDRKPEEWKTIAEEALALLWELVAASGRALRARPEFVHAFLNARREECMKCDLANEHPWNLLTILRNNQKSKAEGG